MDNKESAQNLFDKAIEALMTTGMKKVEFRWNGLEVSAYWAGSVLRIDVKGLNPYEYK